MRFQRIKRKGNAILENNKSKISKQRRKENFQNIEEIRNLNRNR